MVEKKKKGKTAKLLDSRILSMNFWLRVITELVHDIFVVLKVCLLLILLLLRGILLAFLGKEGGIFAFMITCCRFVYSRTYFIRKKFEGRSLSKMFAIILIFSMLLFPLDLISLWVLGGVGLFSLIVLLLAFSYTPFQILNFITRRIMHTIYDLRVEGEDNIPKTGSGVIICNHISFIDFAIISSIVDRHVSFVMDYKIYRVPFIKWWSDLVQAIPIDNRFNPKIKEAAFVKIRKVLKRGDLVLLFPEGQVTYDGRMDFFRRGVARIQQENPDTILIPISISGLVGGYFSRVGELFNAKKLRNEVFRKVVIKVGAPVPSGQMELEELEDVVRSLLNASLTELTEVGSRDEKKVS